MLCVRRSNISSSSACRHGRDRQRCQRRPSARLTEVELAAATSWWRLFLSTPACVWKCDPGSDPGPSVHWSFSSVGYLSPRRLL